MSKKKKPSVPQLPWRLRRSTETIGWDISLEWGVDAKGVCWSNSGHGGTPDIERKYEKLMLDIEHNEDDARLLAQAVEDATFEPKWMRQARAAGWTPPK